jgi:2-dehydropantoate 2-reductase
MGSLFAARLSSFAEVVMLGSWAEQLDTVRKQGLALYDLDGDASRHRFTATSMAADASPSDIALLLVKSWQTEVAASLAKKSLASEGLAITLQNGLGNLETLAKRVGVARAVQGVTSEGATLLGPGEVRHAGHGHTFFAASESTRDRLEQTAALFRQAGFAATVVDDATGLIWGKLAVNAAINPLTALLQIPNGQLLEDERTLDLMRSAAREVADVAERLGVTLPFADPAERAVAVARATSANRSSMAQDVTRGMPTEIEQISGAVVQYGRSLVVPTPVNEALLHLVRARISRGDWRNAVYELPEQLRLAFQQLLALES